MLSTLFDILPKVEQSLVNLEEWGSLIINRRKPYTYRIFRQFGDLRVCLHKFDTCTETEAFMHPHPWPGAFLVLKGAYQMNIGKSIGREHGPVDVAKFIMTEGSAYEITDPLVWHSVIPLRTTYTVMVNGAPFDNPHKDVRTTKGKDLEKMSDEDLSGAMDLFQLMLKYRKVI